MRLFTAILYTDDILDEICKIKDRLGAEAVRGKMTKRENLHLTLAFPGETPPSKMPDIRRAMGKVAFDEFDISLSGLGRFRRRCGDILWMGVTGSPGLQSLAGSCAAEFRKIGFALEDKEYVPHLTLGREVIMPQDFDPENAKTPVLTQRVKEMSLMLSERVRGTLIYTPILTVYPSGKQ